MSLETKLISVAQAEDTQDLLNHLAWTDAIKPRLLYKQQQYEKMLVGHILGQPLPANLTKEQVAGMIYGIMEIIHTFELVLTQGAKALEDIQTSSGISLQR